MMPRRTRYVASAALLTAVAASVACQAAAISTAPPAGVASPTSKQATPAVAATDPVGTGATPAATQTAGESPVGEAELDLGTGEFFLDDPSAGLDALSGYTETLTVSFDGTVDGQSRRWQKRSVYSYRAEPAASLSTFEATGNVVVADPQQIAEVAGVRYIKASDGTCDGRPMATPGSALGLREPVARLPALMGADEAGSEQVSGILADHYTFDERAMAESGRATTRGDLWVATDGDYVVKYIQATDADATYYGGTTAGTTTWSYELTSIDEPPQISVPAGCQLDAPVPPDATGVLWLSQYLGFDAVSGVSDTMRTYSALLTEAGWTVKAEPLAAEGSSFGVFTKDGAVLNVLAAPGEQGTHVDVIGTTEDVNR
jgi:hypothetical protein